MFLVDAILKPADTYWKKQFHAEEIKRRKAEADAKCYKDEADYQHETVAFLSDRDLKQARAIEAFNKELTQLRSDLAAATNTIAARDREIALLNETLKAEREAKEQFKVAQKLWDDRKELRV